MTKESESITAIVQRVFGKDGELDQRLESAIREGGTDEALVTFALMRSNPRVMRYVPDPSDFLVKSRYWLDSRRHGAGKHLERILARAATRSSPAKTLTTNTFLATLIADGLEIGDDYQARPFAIDMITAALDGYGSKKLSQAPNTKAFLTQVDSFSAQPDDFQYTLALQHGRLVFRPVSVLDDYVQASDSGLLLPQRALLTHFKDEFGGFTGDEIQELEDLLNSPSTSESDFQSFFESHTHFLRQWDHREVYPQVTLSRTEGDLIPDFILTDVELQRAAILDLKLSKPKLIRRQRNRDRFASAVMEARSQLLRYRDWFREEHNRNRLKDKLGMTIYEPKMVVVIGRSSEFRDEFDRQLLSADNPELTIVTYDDILTFAKRRRVDIAP